MSQRNKAAALVKEIVQSQTGFICLSASMAEYANRQPEYLIELSLALSEDATGVLGAKLGDIVPKLAEYVNEPKKYNVTRQIVSGSQGPEKNELVRRFANADLGFISYTAKLSLFEDREEEFLDMLWQQLDRDAPESTKRILGPELVALLVSYFESK